MAGQVSEQYAVANQDSGQNELAGQGSRHYVIANQGGGQYEVADQYVVAGQ